jgi:hypothetical protein
MATGPEHYRAAERLLGKLPDRAYSNLRSVQIAEAQVHATLALAAATALLVPEQAVYADLNPWHAVMGRSCEPKEDA